MNLRNIYSWEMEYVDENFDSLVLKQYNEDGSENTWKSLQLDKIIRVSFIPCINLLPRHDCFIDIQKGERFIKRFGTGYHKQSHGFELAEYSNCVVTNNYRMYVLSNGRCLVTHKDYQLNL